LARDWPVSLHIEFHHNLMQATEGQRADSNDCHYDLPVFHVNMHVSILNEAYREIKREFSAVTKV
jgi:hypothetical protein